MLIVKWLQKEPTSDWWRVTKELTPEEAQDLINCWNPMDGCFDTVRRILNLPPDCFVWNVELKEV
jgi:hypothetical protein